MAGWGARTGGSGGEGPGFVACSSTGKVVAASGIRILDGPVEQRRRLSGFSLRLDADRVGSGEEEEEALPSPVARARRCDVYIGYGSGGPAAVGRMVAWLRAELEMLGVPCVEVDRRRCRDGPAHAAARAALDVAAAGVVVVTPSSLANPYAVEEIRAFLDRGKLLPVFVGLGRADCVAEDVVEKSGDLWERFGGNLWMLYDGAEVEWREAVDGLYRAEPAVEVDAGNLRYRLLDVLEIVGARLGRRTMADAVKTWRAEADLELPFPRNAGFVGRERELLDLEAVLLGDVRALDKATGKRKTHLLEAVGEGAFLNGVVCISGESGAGKTELVLEFAHRHAQEYKKVLWVHGEARYVRQSYLKLADRLGVAVGDDMSPLAERSSKHYWSFHDMEGEAIAKIRKELMRDIPYLVVMDNLESERDWWDSRAVLELLPAGGKRTHVIVTTRLSHLKGVRTFTLPNLAAPEAMLLMKGTRVFVPEDTAVLRGIEQRLVGVPLGLALVGAILSELAVGPAELRDEMNNAPYRAPTWAAKDEPALRDNPGLVQLLDACFSLLDRETSDLGTAAGRLVEASGFFAPTPIPVDMLVRAAYGAAGEPLWRRMLRTLHLSCASKREQANTAGRAEPEALAVLLRLGIARRCTREGCVSVHGVFRLFSRKIGSGQVARFVLRTIAAEGSVEEHTDHMWAACLSLFRFQARAVAVELPTLELAQFVTRFVLPLATHGVAAYSSYSAVLELLREATDAVRAVEDLYVAGNDSVELDPNVYQELARARADVLMMRAKLMIRGGEYAIAENHCLTAIGIFEVVCGDAHPETQAARAVLEQAVGSQFEN